MFADVVGSTALIERMDPEQASRVLSSAVEAGVRLVDRFGGTLNKRLGDGLMATFGAPTMLEDHAMRACRCALAIQTELAKRADTDVKMRIGINSGPVLITELVEGTQRTYDAVGAAVHLANRIESAADPGSIFVSENTWRLVRHAMYCRALGNKPVRGFAQPIAIFEVLRDEGSDASREIGPNHLALPFLGRERERTVALNAISFLRDGKGGLLLVVGDAGIGKSRLLSEVRHAAPAELQWLIGHGTDFTEQVSYWPYVELLRPVIGLHDDVPTEDRWQAFERAVFDLFDTETAEVLPYIGTLFGLDMPASYQERVRYLEGEVLGAQIFRATRRLFECLAAHQPLVVLLEDVHWVDASSRALLLHLLPLARTTPILFILSSRSEPERLSSLREIGHRELTGKFEELLLKPLSVTESQHLLRTLLGDDARLARLRDHILYRAEGNPFFLEEIVRELIESRVLVRDRSLGTWSAHDQNIVIPQSVEALLIGRIDRLDERLRDILGVASVIGRSFLYRVLRGVRNTDIDEPLRKLTTVELLDELRSAPELAYLFRHALIHDAVYESLLIDKRRQLHARVAAVLEELFGDRRHEMASVLAFHYTRAQNSERALHYLVEAAEHSSRMAADTEALALYEEAVAGFWSEGANTADDPLRARIEWRLGEIHFRRGDHALAEEHLLRGISFFGEHMPAGRAALALGILKNFVRLSVQILFSTRTSTKQLSEVDSSQEPHLRPYELLCWIYFLTDHARLLFTILYSANLALALGAAEPVIKALGGLGFGLAIRGYHRIAYRYHLWSLRLAARLGHLPAKAFALVMLANCLVMRGLWREAVEALDEARNSAQQFGDLLLWTNACGQICSVCNETSDFGRVIDLTDEMLRLGEEAGFQPALRWGSAERGKALRRTGKLTEAETTLKDAFGRSKANNDIVGAALAGGDLALIFIADGRLAKAEQLLSELRAEIVAHQVRAYPVSGVYVALAELALHRAMQGGSVSRARRACAEARQIGKRYRVGFPAALRVSARLALFLGQRRRARKLRLRAVTEAQVLGSSYELGLIRREESS